MQTIIKLNHLIKYNKHFRLNKNQMFYYNMKKKMGKKIGGNNGYKNKKIKGGGIEHAKGSNIQITLDPLTILLIGIIGFLMYQILKRIMKLIIIFILLIKKMIIMKIFI